MLQLSCLSCQAVAKQVPLNLAHYAFSNELKNSVTMCDVIVEMYDKCGDIDEANRQFHTVIPCFQKTVVCLDYDDNLQASNE